MKKLKWLILLKKLYKSFKRYELKIEIVILKFKIDDGIVTIKIYPIFWLILGLLLYKKFISVLRLGSCP